ncbi:lysophospholipid acyltransferase family protein [Fertoebacter nigrum]|uniref:Lysophospholipid acyltransferase family protein n=1 Tax=Fertoeibacter niger TaxID=2656921 RepID=A0A8X8GW07_9RHOB|nr:lysophospholipid acyltransferase family protein [Fertoeibacter niger]NUB42928.1 lysophospholipid acyltransferase family protein [Fertoeibacter niger]
MTPADPRPDHPSAPTLPTEGATEPAAATARTKSVQGKRHPALWLQNALLRGLIGALLLLPYRWRVPLCGWVMAHVIAPIAGYDRRVRDNLALILPGLPQAEVKRLMRAVPNNVGRTVIEIYSGRDFVARAASQPLTGPGVAALDAAHAAGRPVILVTGHFGNYDASRAALIARGYRVGALYRPMKNLYFNTHYVAAISTIGQPVFPRGRQGLGQMLRFLRGGGMLGMLIDVHMRDGVPLQFFGHDAMTALSAAEMALKYNALMIPTYAIRKADGLSFDIVVEAPIPAGTAEDMTQALNNSLEALVRQHLDQWFWIHRRWKGPPAA